MFPLSPFPRPHSSHSRRWIGPLIGIEMQNVLMSPCIHFFPCMCSFVKSQKHFLFAVNPSGHFQLLPELAVIGSRAQSVRIRTFIMNTLFFSSIPPPPHTVHMQLWCHPVSAIQIPAVVCFIMSTVKKNTINYHESGLRPLATTPLLLVKSPPDCF